MDKIGVDKSCLVKLSQFNKIAVWNQNTKQFIVISNQQVPRPCVLIPRLLVFVCNMQGTLKPFEVRDRRAKDRFTIDDTYLNGWAKQCGIYATGVYISLCRHSNIEQYCWPSLKKIAEEHNISIRQVSRSLTILEKYHIIVREREGKKCNNRYWLTDKSEWTNSPITMDSQSNHDRTNSPIHSKDTHSKDTHSKESNASVAENEFIQVGEEVREISKPDDMLSSLVAFWNTKRSFQGSCVNTTARKKLLPICRKITPPMKIRLHKILKQGYSMQDFKDAIENYCREISTRDTKNTYALHRFSFFDFINQDNGFNKFVNR